MDPVNIIKKVCENISNSDIEIAKKIIREEYPHNFIEPEKRITSSYEKLKVFLRDGFIDRYSGKKLIFPNVLRIMSEELGEVFPYHRNWKMSDCHIAYWDYCPTYDHIIPIARGGKDIAENAITTSQKNNSLKSNFLLEEIHWKIYKEGSLSDWDGMISWYMNYIESNESILERIDNNGYWHKALLKCIEEGCLQTIN
jgi:5-methylcytosine-specific restriction endonuclease McrA